MGNEKAVQEKEAGSRAVQQKKKSGTGLGMTDNRPEAAAQRKMQAMLQSGSSAVSQYAADEGDMMQGKFALQRAPEEEEMGKG